MTRSEQTSPAPRGSETFSDELDKHPLTSLGPAFAQPWRQQHPAGLRTVPKVTDSLHALEVSLSEQTLADRDEIHPPIPRGIIVPTWTADQLRLIAANDDLFVAPFRLDGVTTGTPTQTWALVVRGNVYVRAASGPSSRWYQAAVSQGAGQIRVAGQYIDVTFEAAGDADEKAIDDAYEAKYPGSSAVPIMQGDGPKAAAVRIQPR